MDPRKNRITLNLLALLAAFILLTGFHPANVPVAHAKVEASGQFELTVRFDILAFILDQTPTEVADPPMNALLDATRPKLQLRLVEAQRRFTDKLFVYGDDKAATIDSIKFPSADDVHNALNSGAQPRLPLLMTVTVEGHLPAGAQTMSLKFPEVMETLILTLEFPYQEPYSEPVEPGKQSTPQHVPTPKEVEAAAANIKKRDDQRNALPPVTEAQAKSQIQKQYDTWSTAYMKNDVDQLLAILSPDYTLKTFTGTLISHNEYAAMLSLRKSAKPDTTQYQTEILRVTLHKDIAALVSRETMVTKRVNPTTKKNETVYHYHDYLDAWAFVRGKWLLKSTITQSEKTVVK